MSPAQKELPEALYSAFNARQIDAVLAMLPPGIDWPDVYEGGRIIGRPAVRDYRQRQWAEIDPNVAPTGILRRPNGEVEVKVNQTVHDRKRSLLGEDDVLPNYVFDGNRISRMVIEK
jgi:hypothetical protein